MHVPGVLGAEHEEFAEHVTHAVIGLVLSALYVPEPHVNVVVAPVAALQLLPFAEAHLPVPGTMHTVSGSPLPEALLYVPGGHATHPDSEPSVTALPKYPGSHVPADVLEPLPESSTPQVPPALVSHMIHGVFPLADL